MPNDELEKWLERAPLSELPKKNRGFTLSDVLNDTLDSLVYETEKEGGRTNRSEVVAMLIFSAFKEMSPEELFDTWMKYRRADTTDLKEPGAEIPAEPA